MLNASNAQALFRIVQRAAVPIELNFRGAMTRTLKADGSPVTEVDMEVHETLLQWSREQGLGYVGEEGNGDTNKDEILYVDPLDGTSSYSAGIPTVTVAASIMKRVEGQHYRPTISVIYEPLTGWAWIATNDDGVKVQNSIGSMSRAHVDTTADQWLVTCIFPPGPHRDLRQMRDLINGEQPHLKHQASGSLALCGGLIASGMTHGLAFGGTSAAEVCAMLPIIRGAGGMATDLSGKLFDTFELGENKGKVDFVLPNGAIMANSATLSALLSGMVERLQNT